MTFQPSISVVTAVIGPTTDPLQAPVYVAPGVPYHCVTTQPFDTIPAPWEPRAIEAASVARLSHVEIARWVKILIHNHVSTDIIVWQDAAYQLAVDPVMFIPLLARADVLILAHPHRTRIEQEAEELIRLGLAGPEVRKQTRRYRNKKFPATWPLSSTGLLVRRNDAHVRRFALAWYEHLRAYGHARDQMSFDYCAWSTGLQVHRLEGSYRSNPYAEWTYTRRPRS